MSILSVVGVEDGGFKAFNSEQSTLLCAVLIVGDRVDSLRLGRVTVDGKDVTEVLFGLLVNTRCNAVILGGVSFAGFNVVDPHSLHDKLDVPVIVFSGERPDTSSVFAALKTHFSDWEERWALIARLGEVYSIVTKWGSPPVFYEVIGGSREWAERTLKSCALLTRIPEPVRVAGIVARGLTRSA